MSCLAILADRFFRYKADKQTDKWQRNTTPAIAVGVDNYLEFPFLLHSSIPNLGIVPIASQDPFIQSAC